ncbi:hypothetical protein DAERI_010347 [Deinococcus aerius]|uniref:Uncharacterized protein n=1 Tax=Deinococcus aerius TaxID=200253 RepID=A0A2I9DUV9_9DEIO|nr:hypothetical protein [Deinococcus aerius]GBF04175.1 hypothetical protein DAERI_010347 [Deinococcus aerius]
MNMIALEVFSPRGREGQFGFYSVPRVGEEVVFPGGGRATVRQVVHFADQVKDGRPPPLTQIYVS